MWYWYMVRGTWYCMRYPYAVPSTRYAVFMYICGAPVDVRRHGADDGT